MSAFVEFIKREPTISAAITRGAILLATRFGFDLTVDQLLTGWAIVEALSATWNRSKVSPVK
jgi:hypothetical protein